MEIKIVETKKDLKEFVLFPWQVYKGDPYWVPPLISEVEFMLDPQKNPFWEHAQQKLFLAKRDGKVVGRIAGIIDQNHIDLHREEVGFFGFFEALNDYEIAEALLSQVREWLKEKGMKAMRGPMSPCQNEECGLLVQGLDSSPVLMMPYNPKYYIDLLERFGLCKTKDLYAYHAPILPEPPELVHRAAKSAQQRYPEAKVRHINLKKFKEEKEKIKEIYNSAWEKNWGFVPMTDKEFDSLCERLKPLAVPELILFVEIKGKPAAFMLNIPDYNQAIKKINGRLFPFGLLKLLYYSRKIKTVRTVILGALKEYRMRGFTALLYCESLKNAYKLGYQRVEFSWILEDNLLMRQAAESYAKIYKTYRIYEMKT